MNRLFARWLLLIGTGVLALALAAGAVGCGDDEDDGDGGEEPTATSEVAEPTEPAAGEIPQLDVTARDFSFDVPAEFGGGWVRIVMNNAGAEDHQAQFARLNDGVTFDQFTAALQADETGNEALALITFAGGPNAVVPGGTQETVQELDAGEYVLLCFISGADDVPHVAKGMIAPLTVTEPAAEQPEPPDSDGSVLLQDFEFRPPATLPPGEVTLQVANNGPQAHEMAVLKLDEGTTIDDLIALFSSEAEPAGPPPITSAGGIGAIAAGAEAYVRLDLEAGTYALLCFVPDPETGSSHAELGMVDSFTVQ